MLSTSEELQTLDATKTIEPTPVGLNPSAVSSIELGLIDPVNTTNLFRASNNSGIEKRHLVPAGSGNEPTAQEQYMLELINRMRMNPSGELNLLKQNSDVQSALQYFKVNNQVLDTQWKTLKAVPPVVWSDNLKQVAFQNNQFQLKNDTTGHFYTAGGAQNAFAHAKSVLYGHAGFAIDWIDDSDGIQDALGHRKNIMNDSHGEVGISIVPENNSNTEVGPLVITQNFGGKSGNPWLLGVAYDDADGDKFYDSNEGLEGIIVQAVRQSDLQTFSTHTMSAGGYQMQLEPGIYTVTFSGNQFSPAITHQTVELKPDRNEKRDAIVGVIPEPGNTLGTAYNIGTLSDTRTFRDSVGDHDNSDYYKFTLSKRGNFNLSLKGLSHNSGSYVRLIKDTNNNGIVDKFEVIDFSFTGQQLDRAINRELGAISEPSANYFIEVHQDSSKAIYELSLSTTKPSNLLPVESDIGYLIEGSSYTWNDSVSNYDTADVHRFRVGLNSEVEIDISGSYDISTGSIAGFRLIKDANDNGIVDNNETVWPLYPYGGSSLCGPSGQCSWGMGPATYSLKPSAYLVQAYYENGYTDYSLKVSIALPSITG